jgi:hypothetical protein
MTNSLGYRGPEWDTTRHPRIALMGDSYLLALAVPDERHLATRLRTLTEGEVMNTGVSGFGTYHELLTWRNVLAPRKPDVAVIFVFLRNDIRDNHCGLTSPKGQFFSPCCRWQGDSIVEQRGFTILPGAQSGSRAWLKRNCRTCKAWANRGRKPRTERPEGADPFATEAMAYQIFRPDPGPQWREAWSITHSLLRQLRDETAAAGVPLLVVTIPDPINLDPNWEQKVKQELQVETLPADFDPNVPRRKFQAIADSLQLNVLHSEDFLRSYRDRWKLGDPYFGHTCDGHWNPIAHHLVAGKVFSRIVEKGWIQADSGLWKDVTFRDEEKDPKHILGESIYQSIYEGGVLEY